MKYKKDEEIIFTQKYPLDIGITFKKNTIGKIIALLYKKDIYGFQPKQPKGYKTYCCIPAKDLENCSMNLKQKKIQEILK